MVPDFVHCFGCLLFKKKMEEFGHRPYTFTFRCQHCVSSRTTAMAELSTLYTVYYGKNVQYGSVKYLMLNLNRKLL